MLSSHCLIKLVAKLNKPCIVHSASSLIFIFSSPTAAVFAIHGSRPALAVYYPNPSGGRQDHAHHRASQTLCPPAACGSYSPDTSCTRGPFSALHGSQDGEGVGARIGGTGEWGGERAPESGGSQCDSLRAAPGGWPRQLRVELSSVQRAEFSLSESCWGFVRPQVSLGPAMETISSSDDCRPGGHSDITL